MAFINWDLQFHIDPLTLEPTTEESGTIAFPTYGHFGGPLFTAGVLQTDTGPEGSFNDTPVDNLDALFKVHDEAATGPTADATLLQGIADLKPNQLDAEGSLYAGVTALALVGELAATDSLDLLSPKELKHDVRDALHDIQRGIQHLPSEDLAELQDLLVQDAPFAGLVETAVESLVASTGVHLPHHGDFLHL